MIFWSLLNWVDFEIFQRHFGSWAIVARVWTRDRPKLIQAYLFMSGNTPDQGFKISWFLGGSISPLIQHTSVKWLHWNGYYLFFILWLKCTIISIVHPSLLTTSRKLLLNPIQLENYEINIIWQKCHYLVFYY